MLDTMTMTKVVGAFCGALLVYLLGGWIGEALYSTGGHGDHHQQAYVIDTGEADEAAAAEDGGAAEPEVPFLTLVREGDPAAGERVWRQCAACHKIDEPANAVGPHLDGVVGREIAAIGDFRYSGALPDGDWSIDNLNAWLENPSGFASGTSMSYNGVKDREDRANLIAYMITKSPDFEMPEAEAALSEEAAASPEAPMEEVSSATAEAAPEPEEAVAAAGEAAPETADAAPETEEATTETTETADAAPETAETADADTETESAGTEAPAEETAMASEDAKAETTAEAATEMAAMTEQEPAGTDTAEATAEAGEAAPAPVAEMSPIAAAYEAADLDAGGKVWRQCQACHVADKEQNRVGPHLVGIVGREIGSVDGFRYSGALPDGEWTLDELNAWLENPRDYAKGTSMSYRGLTDLEDRANVLAYIMSLN